MPRLKVFCATSGFHDSIVAAPSRPAALKAWGARTDLFSMGVARQVTDPKIVRQALARPGQVIRLSRSGEVGDAPSPNMKASKKVAAKPPSRVKLAAAEKRMEQLEEKQAEESDAMEQALAVLSRKRDLLIQRHKKARRAVEERVAEAREAYQAALDDWQG
jgi:hypothetical protein